MMMLPSHSIAHRLPDLPRWVEVRGLLLEEGREIFGFQETPEFSFILPQPELASIFVIGKPAIEQIRAAVREGTQIREVISPPEHADWLAGVLSEWRRSRIIVYTLPDLQHLPIPPTDSVRFLEPATIPHLAMEEELRRELENGATYSPIAAAFVEDQPVSFCYAGSMTESLWDVSIDTLPQYQRKGYAAQCAAFMIRHMHTNNKHPVWQALEDNPASWRLAQRLGFVPVDELFVFERHQQ